MRTFIAIELPPALQRYVRDQQRHIQDVFEDSGVKRSFRWTRVKNIHLTLRFLGETSEVQSQQMERDLVDVARVWQPFRLTIGVPGCFPRFQRPTVIWLGLQGQLDTLNGMQAHIEDAAQRAGFEPDARAYSPHLTIGRVQRNALRSEVKRAGQVLRQYIDDVDSRTEAIGEAASFDVDQFAHMRSDLQAGGPLYTRLAAFSLA
jgi:2'-5' RNA ligase